MQFEKGRHVYYVYDEEADEVVIDEVLEDGLQYSVRFVGSPTTFVIDSKSICVHFSADNYPVYKGRKFWNNDLRVVTIVKVAAWANAYADTGETSTWHQTTRGAFDTLSGHMRPYGRLARFYQGRDAEELHDGAAYIRRPTK